MSQPTTQPVFTTRGNQPLIGIPVEENGETVVYYFNSYEEADKAFPKDDSVKQALSAIGGWKELDTDDGPDPLDELDKMRHESKPTPPFKP